MVMSPSSSPATSLKIVHCAQAPSGGRPFEAPVKGELDVGSGLGTQGE